MTIPFYHIDAFASRPFTGNPAAVCILPGPGEADWMQQVAAEMNLSETAFLHRLDDGWSLRWFTPWTEVDLCGHATLASAHALWESGLLDEDTVARFHTRSGLLTAEREDGAIVMDFPATESHPTVVPEALLAALGTIPVHSARIGRSLLLEVPTAEAVLRLRPDFAAMAALPGYGVAVTALSEEASEDFVSRYFAPWVGIAEDPVTGSAHCGLGPWWSKRLGKDTVVGFQASARGGHVRVEVRGERVRLGGAAITVVAGMLQHA